MTTAIIKVCKFVSAKQYHLYFPQVKRENEYLKKLYFLSKTTLRAVFHKCKRGKFPVAHALK